MEMLATISEHIRNKATAELQQKQHVPASIGSGLATAALLDHQRKGDIVTMGPEGAMTVSPH